MSGSFFSSSQCPPIIYSVSPSSMYLSRSISSSPEESSSSEKCPLSPLLLRRSFSTLRFPSVLRYMHYWSKLWEGPWVIGYAMWSMEYFDFFPFIYSLLIWRLLELWENSFWYARLKLSKFLEAENWFLGPIICKLTYSC